MPTYKGKYKPKNKEKYVGNASEIVYRSLWERNVFRWLDENPQIAQWASEEIVVPYLCETDRKMHRYFVDVWFCTTKGEKFLIEIKPKRETMPPKKGKRQTKRYLQESLTYIKNQCKWKAAHEFALDKGWKFQVWHEDILREIGIKVL